MKPLFTEIPTKLIDPSPFQKRQRFDQESLQRLADDIKLNGLLNPILCRPLNGRYELVHGERRFRASVLIPWETITGQIREMTDLEARRICAAENVHRVDLTPIELVEATADLLDSYLIEMESYLNLADTYLDRVYLMLKRLNNEQRLGIESNSSNNFIRTITKALQETNRNLEWQSFYINALHPYLKLDEDVKDVAIEHSLPKSKTFALQQLKEASPESFEAIKETKQVDLGIIIEDKYDIGEVSARELRILARREQEKSGYTFCTSYSEVALPPANHEGCIYEDDRTQLWWADAHYLFFIPSNTIDLIVTSPPYNIGPKEGMGRVLWRGVRYSQDDDDRLPEDKYQCGQILALNEMWRVARPGASLFYNHKIRNRDGSGIHPLTWILKSKWNFRQEIVWDRGSTHNHEMTYFWPVNELIFWLTKGTEGIYLSPEGARMTTIWSFPFSVNSDHPAPFPEELPLRCIRAASREGEIVLDPFGGKMTTCTVARKLNRRSIGVDRVKKYVEKAVRDLGEGA